MSRRKKRKPPKGPSYKAWIVGHEIKQENPLVVCLIEAGGPISTGTALAYLYRHFRIEVNDDALGMETHGVRPHRRWNLSRDSTDFIASEATRKPINREALWPRLWEVSASLNSARDQLNDALRRVEQELLRQWPTAATTVELETWEGLTHRLTWDKALYIDTNGTQRKSLLNASIRLRVLAVDALAQLKEQLQAA